ncbi:DUF746 domain-containing protein [Burkholderia ubonensis]|uniref:DUF746 domain-containing protein n=1 Tax=Burkholderia ubonensis TaxID=101571 RepID=UPI000A725685|nr:DUF746 domain-containing protein [Burkholderia ubonensis]
MPQAIQPTYRPPFTRNRDASRQRELIRYLSLPLPIIELSEMIQADGGIMARLISEFRERCDRRLRQKWRNKPRKFSDLRGFSFSGWPNGPSFFTRPPFASRSRSFAHGLAGTVQLTIA